MVKIKNNNNNNLNKNKFQGFHIFVVENLKERFSGKGSRPTFVSRHTS